MRGILPYPFDPPGMSFAADCASAEAFGVRRLYLKCPREKKEHRETPGVPGLSSARDSASAEALGVGRLYLKCPREKKKHREPPGACKPSPEPKAAQRVW